MYKKFNNEYTLYMKILQSTITLSKCTKSYTKACEKYCKHFYLMGFIFATVMNIHDQKYTALNIQMLLL